MSSFFPSSIDSDPDVTELWHVSRMSAPPWRIFARIHVWRSNHSGLEMTHPLFSSTGRRKSPTVTCQDELHERWFYSLWNWVPIAEQWSPARGIASSMRNVNLTSCTNIHRFSHSF
jgi:hypothetical protein